MAKAIGVALPISFKKSVEICNHIRGKAVADAKNILKDASKLKKAIPFKRFTNGAGHKKIKGAGKYPVKACSEIVKLIESVEANAQFKGLNTSQLIIRHICAQKGGKAWHYGRKRGRKMKRTTIEVVLEEKVIKDKKKEETENKTSEKPAETKEATKKTELKQEVKKEEKKTEEKSAELPKEKPKPEQKKQEKKENPKDDNQEKKESKDKEGNTK